MRKLYEKFQILHFQKRIVSAETIRGYTVYEFFWNSFWPWFPFLFSWISVRRWAYVHSIFSNIVYAIAICLSMCYIFLWSFLFGCLSISLFFTVHSPNKNSYISNFEKKENYLIFQLQGLQLCFVFFSDNFRMPFLCLNFFKKPTQKFQGFLP